jgi:hypothetical protein
MLLRVESKEHQKATHGTSAFIVTTDIGYCLSKYPYTSVKAIA